MPLGNRTLHFVRGGEGAGEWRVLPRRECTGRLGGERHRESEGEPASERERAGGGATH